MDSEIQKHPLEYGKFLKHLNEESDRGAVLSGAALLEDLLGVLILTYLRDTKTTKDLLEGFNAPLGTFSSRIKMANSLGLVTETEYKDLEKVRKIRNYLAHNWNDVDFENPSLKSISQSLEMLSLSIIEAGYNPRECFNCSVCLISLNLINRINSIKPLNMHDQVVNES